MGVIRIGDTTMEPMPMVYWQCMIAIADAALSHYWPLDIVDGTQADRDQHRAWVAVTQRILSDFHQDNQPSDEAEELDWRGGR
jgi:hypothetical protein